eukprot:1185799-Prymnesium_polylepis.1
MLMPALEAESRLETMRRAWTGLRPAASSSCIDASPSASSDVKPPAVSCAWQFSRPTERKNVATSSARASASGAPACDRSARAHDRGERARALAAAAAANVAWDRAVAVAVCRARRRAPSARWRAGRRASRAESARAVARGKRHARTGIGVPRPRGVRLPRCEMISFAWTGRTPESTSSS